MRQMYRMFRRGNVYWIQNNNSAKQESLRTKDRDEAVRLLGAKNEATRQPIINVQIARAYLMVGDPESATPKGIQELPAKQVQHIVDFGMQPVREDGGRHAGAEPKRY